MRNTVNHVIGRRLFGSDFDGKWNKYMVANTSKKAAVKNKEVRWTQARKVFNTLALVYPEPENAEYISRITGIKVSTVHARLNNLKEGIVYKNAKTGEETTYYVYPKSTGKNSDGNEVILWGLTTEKPHKPATEQLAELDKKLIKLFKERQQLRELVKQENNASLF